MVSHGTPALLRLALACEPEDPRYPALRRELFDLYRADLVRDTRLFPGMSRLLTALESRGMRWGVVTNKPAELTHPLMAALDLRDRACCVVSGDTTAWRKPHPGPMLYACRAAGSTPAQCAYVGDAERDIQAGRAAGMLTLVALFGYLGSTDRPETWGADAMVSEPLEVLGWIDARGTQ